MKLLAATRNPGKLAEIRALFDLPGIRIVGADELAGLPGVDEDGATFEANAVKKAVTLARAAGLWALADDSGLEVDALGGAPGVRSARYAGEAADPRANNRKLLAALAGRADRAARFRCVVALSDPAGEVRTAAGACEGRIVEAPRGARGFGYDPLFAPAGETRTFAEMPPAEKHARSHRGAALREAVRRWSALLHATAGA